ncbi:MAG: hypothetical protein Q8L23_08505 [Caulobacter sp.]|nr:hypothetical protein [Caulobacter sp.]
MRTLIIAAALSVIGVATPSAQPAPAAPAAPSAPLGAPRAFQGYSQPDIGANYCRVINPGQTTCTLPAMTAGRYLVKASGTSTAQGPGAAQQLTIIVGNRTCGPASRKPTTTNPWTAGPKTIRLYCEILVLTDRPLAVTAAYADAKATKAPAGPSLTLERQPWEGVLDVSPTPTPQDP